MSFVASARVRVPASPEACFARLIDYPSWERWMPASFRPMRGPSRPLSVGDRMNVRIHAQGIPLPAALRVARVEPGRVVAWGGGVPGLLEALHEFHLEPDGEGGTMVRSDETWSGTLADVGFIARRVKSMAEQIGRAQIEGLARDLARNPR